MIFFIEIVSEFLAAVGAAKAERSMFGTNMLF
jgi:hypothetical protein